MAPLGCRRGRRHIPIDLVSLGFGQIGAQAADSAFYLLLPSGALMDLWNETLAWSDAGGDETLGNIWLTRCAAWDWFSASSATLRKTRGKEYFVWDPVREKGMTPTSAGSLFSSPAYGRRRAVSLSFFVYD